jgi:division protein CdvB (Snf7/Vps24/ESCRT-III family)
MNIGEYINSGVLMDYCLGLLTADEKKEVEKLGKVHPEIANELQQLQSGLEQYAIKKTTWNKEALKNKIWETIDKINKGDKNNTR